MKNLPDMDIREISRIISAAVVNECFRDFLLTEPRSAIHSGYMGETFHLTAPAEDIIVDSVNMAGRSLSAFALKVAELQYAEVQ